MESVVEAAENLWIEGRRLNDIGHFTAAAITLSEARELAVGSPTPDAARILIRIDITMALTDLELHGYPVAAQRLEKATWRARDLGASDLVGLTHIQHGVIDARCGMWSEASEQLRQAEVLFAHIGPVEQCSALITLGLAELSLSQVNEAQASLERARLLASEHDLPVHLFKATHNLGCVAYVAGNLPEALRLMTIADSMPVDVARERAKIDLGAVLLEAGLVDQSREALSAALDTARESAQRLDEGEILGDLARCALLDDTPDLARDLAEQARVVFESLGAGPRSAAAELLIARLDTREGSNLEHALEVGRRWSHEVDTSVDVVDAVLLRAEVRLAQGSLDACASELRRVSEARVGILMNGSGLLSKRLHELYLRARLADEQQDAAAFARAVAESSRLCASAQGEMSSLELRAALAQHVSPTAVLDLDRALRTRDVKQAFATVERWRAASQRSLTPSLGVDADLARKLARLRWLRSGIAQDFELDQLAYATEIESLERTISLATWQQEAVDSRVDQPLSLAELRAVLPDRTGFLIFSSTNESCHAIVIGPEGESLVDLGAPAPLRVAIQRLRRDLRGSAFAHARLDLRRHLKGAVDAAAQEVSDLIIAPAVAKLGDIEALVIAPNDLLHAVPWALLPLLEGLPITVAPSASVWARLSANPSLIVREVGSLAGPRVDRGVIEAADVASTWREAGVKVSSEDVPSRAALAIRTLAEADIVHIAAHGHHAEDNPLFSSLLMADGPLFAHELVKGVQARHVVLSACDVGRSKIRAGGEALGLTAALLALGAQTVIAAVAPIPDEISAGAAVAYHRALVRGKDAASALAEAIAATPGAEALCCFGGSLRVSFS